MSQLVLKRDRRGLQQVPRWARGSSDSSDQSRRPSVPAAAIVPLAHHRLFQGSPMPGAGRRVASRCLGHPHACTGEGWPYRL